MWCAAAGGRVWPHLAEHEAVAAIDEAVARHHTITGVVGLLQPKVRAPVGDQGVVLCERPGVHQQLHTLAGSELPALVLMEGTRQTHQQEG